ncbi:MAG TPA: tripartite tricarboxylate transporter substrate binding protein [Burkholderiales bacterium]|nr:tripartite tricarboxylate transporter substrate binding protein [Burkholderiales bacterium]
MQWKLALAAAAAVGSTLSWSGLASAAGYPDKPIRWIIPFPPGGSNDVLGRYLGEKLTERLHQQVVIDNRAGANGIIGTELAAQSPADGYTVLMISTSFVMNAAVRSLPYNVEKSFDPIATIATAPNCIVTSSKSNIGSVRELVERAKAAPGKINYASTGVGGFNHFGGELFKSTTGVNLVHVPYRGGAPAMTDVMAGQVPIMFSSLTQVLPNVRSGRLKLLAVGASKRSPVVPDVPTVAESGYPGYEVAVWWGVSAPAGVPRGPREALQKAFDDILADPATRQRLMADAAEPMPMKSAEIRRMIHAEVEKWTDVARRASIHVPGTQAAR